MTIITETVQVESFEVIERELGEQAPEMEAEAIALVEKLDLEGQRTFTQDRVDDGVAVRVPFRMATDEEMKVYAQILPNKASIQDYAAGPIPLRILHLVEKAKETDFFDKGLVIWYKRDSLAKDPLLIGLRAIPGQTYGEHTYILGRWGEVLMNFEELVVMAREQWIIQMKAHCTHKKQEVQSFVDQIEARADEFFSGRFVATP